MFTSIARFTQVQAAGTVTGIVFQDFNGNGTYDTSGGTADAPTAVDDGIVGAVVTAYDSTGTAQGTATTAADGTYSLTTTGTGPYRLEFVPPAGFQPSARNSNSLFNSAANGSGSTVIFIAEGSTADVNVAFNRPEEYCQNNPDLVTCRYNLGAQNGMFAASPILQNFAYNAGTVYTDTTVANYDAPTAHTLSVPSSSIGSVFGLAYSRSTQRIYAAAYYKRHSGFGPGANGAFGTPPTTNSDDSRAIYVVNPANNAVTATYRVPGATSNNHSNAAADDTTNESFDAVGKTGLGGIALSDDESRLFAMNLQNNTLYAFDPNAPTPTGTADSTPLASQIVPTPANCPAADVRPFAVKYYRGNVYVGMVCSAQSTAAAANLRAYVYQVNPTTLAFGATPYTFSLNYNRGFANNGAANTAEWRPWFSTIPTANFSYPQPMLTDVEFDNGNMVLGIRDRYGDQGLENVVRPGGETLRSCGAFTAANFPGTLTLEANGRCGGIGTAPQDTGQGPGAAPGTAANSGEYYFQEDFSIPANGANFHDEVSLGGLLHVPGYGQTIATIFDPIARPISDQVYDGGFRWLDSATGATTKAYRIYDGNNDPATTPDFGKANGLGDLIALCDSAPIEIGNRVWRDANGNGVQDPQESRAVAAGYVSLAGITVRLYNAANVLVGTAITDQDGEYYFTSGTAADPNTGDNIGVVNGGILPNTAYQIRFDNAADFATGGVLAGLIPTINNATQQAGIDDASDSDAVRVTNPVGSPANGVFPVINHTTGAAGANNHTLDAGFVAPVSIGSTVFNDPNNNGIQDAGEAGIGGVTVELLYDANNDGVINGTEATTAFATTTTTTTGTVGNYFFNNLTPGNYQVRIPTAPAAATLSSTTAATTDNQVDGNDDGVQTGGAGGVTLSPVISLLPGAEPTTTETGQGGAQDDTAPNVDANGDMTIDFGFLAPASVGNLLFTDTNGNGIQDTGELGINGVTVTLYNAAGTAIATTTTATVGGVAGQYLFAGLAPGTYSVGFGTPAGFIFSPQDQGGNDALDSDVSRTTGRTANFTLAAGQINNDIDAGVFQSVSVGNRVFNDLNNNGVFEAATESGIQNVVVNLYLDANNDGVADGTAITSTTTDANGLYLFSGLAPNTYIIGVATPAGYASSFVNGGDPDNNTDNDDNGVLTVGTETRSNPVTLALTTEPTGETPTDATTPDNSSNQTVDFGFFQSYSLGNRVFNDVNNDGLRAATGEPGIAGVTVRLLTTAGVDFDFDPNTAGVQSTVVTDANGFYRFDGLPAGSYIVQIDAGNFAAGAPLAALASSDGAGQETNPNLDVDNNDDGIDSKVTSGTFVGAIRSGTVTLGPNGSEPTGETDLVGGANPQGTPNDAFANMTVDFGFTAEVAVGNRIFNDVNNSGTLDGTETGIAGVVVNLYAGTTLIATTTTDANGFYAFKNIAPGDYIVELAAANFNTGGVLAGFRSSTGANNAFEGTATPDVDAVATDSDDNGTTTGTLGAGGVVRTLPITLTVGGEPTGENNGGTVTTTDNAANLTADFGLFQTYSLGNRIFNDANNNGTRDAAEIGIANVVVRLLTAAGAEIDSDPNTAGVQPTTRTTDANGYYRFDNLAAGSYIVQVDAANFAAGQPLALLASSTGAGQEAAPDSNVDNNDNGLDLRVAGAVRSGTVTLGGGAEPTNDTGDLSASGEGVANSAFGNMTVDFGFTSSYSVGNRIFRDLNNNGQRDAGDTGIGGATVRLLNAAGTVVLATTTSDANGYYRFDNVAPGDYIVEVVNPAGLQSSTGSGGDPDTNLSDTDNNGEVRITGAVRSLVFTIGADAEPTGETDLGTGGQGGVADNHGNMTIDFGFQNISTAVTLVSFESTAYNNGVMLEWQTGYEVGNLGFNIYRERGGKRELVNPELIAGSAFVGGANAESKSGFAYNWFDAAGSADALYFIEDLGVDGKSSAGETAIQKAAVSENSNENANARLLSDLSSENNAQSEVFAAEIVKAKAAGDVNRKGRTVTVNALANEAAVKLAVKQTGWQRVERAALTAAGLPETAEPTTYQLFADGKEQALRVNSDNSIEFYGTAAASVLSDARVYWLTWNKTIGKRITKVDGTTVENAQTGSFRSTVERRDNSIYVPSVLNGDRENFFDAVILNQAVRQNVNLRSLDAANNVGSLEVDFQGFTVNTAHSVRIDINGSSIGTAEFNSTERKTLRFAIDSNILRDGANEVSFVEQNGEGNVSLVEAFRVTYAKRYRADNGKLTFSPAANQPILVEGFASANVRVVDVTDAANPVEIQVSTEPTADGFAARVPASAAKHTLVAFAADAVQTAPTAAFNNPSDLRGFKDGAAFVILTHGDFQTAAERLAEARRAGGLSTVVVNVADVYDEYNFGAASTAGVREFLANAAATWTIKPQYLLLMGDTSADTHNYLGHNNNFVPTQFFESSNLEASGDDLLSDFNNDGMADLSTGRLPVRTAAQADAVVSKLLAYENGSAANVKANGALLVADEGFEAMNSELGAAIENRMSITNINRVDGSTGEIRQRILDGINSGARIVSYAGHGSNRIWSSNQMFKAADAANLTNGENLSLFVNLTCYNGFVADPTVESLGEALINNERGGAFAVWASSGMTFANEQALIGKAFYDQIVNNPKTRIGDAARTAKQATNDQDVRRTWTLLGDPTMRLR